MLDREAVMKGMLLLLLALPFGAARAGLVFADFEGTVTSVVDEPGYAVGDPIWGRLVIDTVLAGPDTNPDPNRGDWGTNEPDVFPSFVSGWLSGGSGLHTDSVGTFNSDALDAYSLADDASLGYGRNMRLSAAIHGMLDDAGIWQSFEVTAADVDEDDEFLRGSLVTEYIGDTEFARGVQFLLSRLTVRPGRCFRP